eukprot:SAG11_NODE_795_length_7131_cov_7.053185_5_plen_127_part_00
MHADCAALDKAVKAIQEVAQHINDMAREDDDRQKVVEIHSRFKQPKDDDHHARGALAALVQPRRRFVQYVGPSDAFYTLHIGLPASLLSFASPTSAQALNTISLCTATSRSCLQVRCGTGDRNGHA